MAYVPIQGTLLQVCVCVQYVCVCVLQVSVCVCVVRVCVLPDCVCAGRLGVRVVLRCHCDLLGPFRLHWMVVSLGKYVGESC